uniref:Daunorubicin resistance ABC transporter ATPase subunit n=1 Tax=uncultured bacterium A1Q1_fos_962 TaxID=1256592 RepID=L7VX17_9BACT|nr:daunorubicin resistance ABC transporter ATPase subunit [uncultured bacterium A1Q1_fos_962]
MNGDAAIEVRGLSHAYGARHALREVDLEVKRGELFALLGPNGGGKTTLFRILSTLMPHQMGEVRISGHDLRTQLFEVRHSLGVVFQSPSLDKKLSIDENITQQAALYGLSRSVLQQRREEVLEQLGLMDRRHDRIEVLSGGLKRRADLAKSLIHLPRILLLDEPTTGLDPGARSDLWRYLGLLRDRYQMTIALTSHLLEEADRADRIAILHEGQVVVRGNPSELRAELGAPSLTIETDQTEWLFRELTDRFATQVSIVDQAVRLEQVMDSRFVQQLMDDYPEQIKSVKWGRPTLEDLFIRHTGHRFWQEPETPPTVRQSRR